MIPTAFLKEQTIVRRVFPAWSIELPTSFVETFVRDGDYWHAYDEHRSVSLTSIAMTDRRGPVPAAALAKSIPRLDGDPIRELPGGLIGRAVLVAATQPARASHALSGMLAAAGRILVVTITSDDLAWVRRTWLSIRHQPAELPPRRERRARRRTRDRRR